MSQSIMEMAIQRADLDHEVSHAVEQYRTKLIRFLDAKKAPPGGVTRFRKFEKTLYDIQDFFEPGNEKINARMIHKPTRQSVVCMIADTIDTIEVNLLSKIKRKALHKPGLVNALLEEGKDEDVKVFNEYMKLFKMRAFITFLAYSDSMGNSIAFDLSIERIFSYVRQKKMKLKDQPFTIQALYWLDQHGPRECVISLNNFIETLNTCTAKELQSGEKFLMEIESAFTLPEYAFGKMYGTLEKFFNEFLAYLVGNTPKARSSILQERMENIRRQKEDLMKQVESLNREYDKTKEKWEETLTEVQESKKRNKVKAKTRPRKK